MYSLPHTLMLKYLEHEHIALHTRKTTHIYSTEKMAGMNDGHVEYQKTKTKEKCTRTKSSGLHRQSAASLKSYCVSTNIQQPRAKDAHY